MGSMGSVLGLNLASFAAMSCLLLVNIGTIAAAESRGDGPVKVIRSARSGPWSAGATWEGGKTPGTGVKVQIREGHTIVYDVNSDR